MNRFLYFGVSFATLALVFYSIHYWRNRARSGVTKAGCLLQTTGLEFDVAGTILMIVGSKNIPLTVHGLIGYAALLAMLAKTALIWRRALRGGEAGTGERLYGTIAYFWWIAAYVAGGVLAMTELRG